MTSWDDERMRTIKSDELKIGDIVKIVREGLQYSNYDKWAKRHHATKWKQDQEPNVDGLFKVVAMGEHTPNNNNQYYGKMLYLIEDIIEEKQYIFERAGLQFVSYQPYFKVEEFEL